MCEARNVGSLIVLEEAEPNILSSEHAFMLEWKEQMQKCLKISIPVSAVCCISSGGVTGVFADATWASHNNKQVRACLPACRPAHHVSDSAPVRRLHLHKSVILAPRLPAAVAEERPGLVLGLQIPKCRQKAVTSLAEAQAEAAAAATAGHPPGLRRADGHLSPSVAQPRPRWSMCRVGALLLVVALVACEGAAGQGPDAGEQRGPADAAAFLRMRAAGGDGDGDGKDALLEKRAPLLGFHGVRGKKDDLDKRAPSLGFHGVRGKKDDADDDDGFDKRAPMRGFQGVRGKKDEAEVEDAELGDGADYLQLAGLPYREDYDADADGDADADELQLDDPWLRDEKRALKGFFGTRGKKAPQAGFYGVRGKKGPSGFYGVRGKKAPLSGFYGVRGKKAPSLGFHGVRGKKDDGASPPDLDSLLYYLNEASEATRQKRGNTKKAPVGFYGTRGKKSWAPDGGAASSSDSIASSLINSQ
ncbi:uncharacterized protein LOC126218298 [Schistocerca nitens]|uniref:uncharacterized protein LOC126218298 n=1 Tax=Schistocerca nitens TaxID=7011 RepID=UPI002119954F|nr:uncharacterized protein LOC126218298 [Schistocerca nitens]